MLEEIYQTMRKVDAGKYELQHERQARGEDVSLADCAPDLPSDLNYRKVRDGLLAMFGPEAFRPPGLLRRTFGG